MFFFFHKCQFSRVFNYIYLQGRTVFANPALEEHIHNQKVFNLLGYYRHVWLFKTGAKLCRTVVLKPELTNPKVEDETVQQCKNTRNLNAS